MTSKDIDRPLKPDSDVVNWYHLPAGRKCRIEGDGFSVIILDDNLAPKAMAPNGTREITIMNGRDVTVFRLARSE